MLTKTLVRKPNRGIELDECGEGKVKASVSDCKSIAETIDKLKLRRSHDAVVALSCPRLNATQCVDKLDVANHMKRKRESEYIENPSDEGIKIRSTTDPHSLTRSISPPVVSRRKSSQLTATTAQVEAGEKDVENHLSFFSSKLYSASRVSTLDVPRLDHQSWIDLYTSNINHPRGHHFVIHQHDHPVSGTHYDLRLQCNQTSSVSWAIMYGLPGDPNSRRLNRNATETRIHCLWNHLVETASHQTGTLLIWDTGHYEVLPYYQGSNGSADQTTDEDDSESDKNSNPDSKWSSFAQPEKLHISFQNRKIRLRLHGTRLPRNYTISIRLSKDNNRTEQPAAPKTRRKKGVRNPSKPEASESFKRGRTDRVGANSDTDSNSTSNTDAMVSSSPRLGRKLSSLRRHESPPHASQKSTTASSTTVITTKNASPNSVAQRNSNLNTDSNTNLSSNPSQTIPIVDPNNAPETNEQERIRLNNAYPGATNSINSIHQRKWYLSLDPTSSGFTRTAPSSTPHRQRWTPPTPTPSSPGRRTYPFHVLGPSHERSVVTGRLAGDILADEGVVGYVPRGRWRAVTD